MICRVCNRVHGPDWNPRHQPVYGDDPTGSLPRKEERRHPTVGVAASPFPFDPVLRQALIDKGVLTPDDLRAAQEKIAVITSATMGVVPGGPYRSSESSAKDAGKGD